MNLRVATITVKPDDWAAILQIANDKGLSRAAYLRLLVADAVAKAQVAPKVK
jgi:hypothetical protein